MSDYNVIQSFLMNGNYSETCLPLMIFGHLQLYLYFYFGFRLLYPEPDPKNKEHWLGKKKIPFKRKDLMWGDLDG